MSSVLDTCKPRPELLAGTINLDAFTASLSPIIEYYRNGQSSIDSIYTNAELFFREATYLTQGLRTTLSEVFSRIAGDMTVPAIHRLETAFGGGKTHTLISCTHIAYKGTELGDVIQNILDLQVLPEPGSVAVVGVAGDEIPVHKPKGDALVPYTLWGEIAYQIGGESLYLEVEEEASSYAAPGKNYFKTVFEDRKVLIMLDELAQYAARLEAARPDGASQLAAFMMALHGYARNNSGIAVVITLASAADAFGKQSEKLADLISEVRGENVSEDDALGIGEKAVQGVASVTARDAVQITPVQAAEISSVLAKRLFSSVDRDAAQKTAQEYMELYRRNASLLPDEASSEDYKGRMIANYPFHPTLVDFLNKKLASAENFQGTRGVLRVLALAVRNLWQKRQHVPMIHTCHLDLREERVVNEILNRTGSSDILYVLNADVGGVDTGKLEGGRSNAELADSENPHPEGHPFHEYTWKTVFLHSLVGREEGLNSNIFGITESEALLSVSFSGLTPSQVAKALEKIGNTAFYLRYDQGKYFASEEPTINAVLAKIRKTLKGDEVRALIQDKARSIISGDVGLFHVEHDVMLPEDLPDGKCKPVLGVVSPIAESIDIQAMVTTKGENKPREQQNLIFILAPKTVIIKGTGGQEGLFPGQNNRIEDDRQYLERVARQVKAMRKLKEKPQSYGVNPLRLQEEDFKKRYSEREQALNTAMAGIYTGLYYPSAAGQLVRGEIKSAGGESGTPFIEQIKELLIENNELLTEDHTTQSDLQNLSQLFFQHGDTVTLDRLRQNFYCIRSWPVLENAGVLERIVRVGVQRGVWCLFRMGAAENVKPAEIYYRETGVPMEVNLNDKGYSLITPQGAKKRNWTADAVDPEKVREGITYVLAREGVATVDKIAENVKENYGEIPDSDFEDVVVSQIKKGSLIAYRGTPDQTEKPELIRGVDAAIYTPQPGDVLITPAEAAQRGWLTSKPSSFSLSGREGAEVLLPLLRRLGSIYNRGAKSTVQSLDLVDLKLPEGGTLSIQLADVTPESMQTLGEIFEVLDNVVEQGEYTEAFLEIAKPDDDCLFIKELKEQKGEAE
ncbi:ATP-binding protein [Desulfolucanica intricata]|uniref:ATP-binding protein n=1 Tax=Desulfolucanica intricata TaxID=1285191 RepID=UPI00082C895D|nr:DUF499 domain-containing protein [Desulfolucanica intricata]